MWLWQNFESWMQPAKFIRNCRINNLDDFEREETDAYLRRARVLNGRERGMTLCYIMKRCLAMLLSEGKVNVVEYWWKILVKLRWTSDHSDNGSATKNPKY